MQALRGHLGCPDLAADSLHDAWLRVAEGGAAPAPAVLNPGAYVFRMACNIAIDRLRAERLPGAAEVIWADIEDTAPGPQRIAQARSCLLYTSAERRVAGLARPSRPIRAGRA